MPKPDVGTRLQKEIEREHSPRASLPAHTSLQEEIDATRCALSAAQHDRFGNDTRTNVTQPISQQSIDAARHLYDAMRGTLWGLGTEKKVLMETLKSIPESEMPSVARAYSNIYSRKGRERDLVEDLRKELRGESLRIALKHVQGRSEDAEVLAMKKELNHPFTGSSRALKNADLSLEIDKECVRLDRAFKGRGANAFEVNEILERNATRLDELSLRYQQLYKKDLWHRINHELSAIQGEAARAAFKLDRGLQLSLQVHAALREEPVNFRDLQKIIYDTSAAEREQMTKAYRIRFGETIEQALERRSPIVRSLVEALVRDGAFSWHGELTAALLERKPQVEEISSILADRSKSEIDDYVEGMREGFQIDIPDLVRDKFSGRRRREVQRAFEGASITWDQIREVGGDPARAQSKELAQSVPNEMLRRARAHERDERSGLTAKVVPVLDPEKRHFIKRSTGELSALIDEVSADGEITHSEWNALKQGEAEVHARFRSVGYTNADTSQKLATGAVTLAEMGVVAATGGLGIIPVVAIGAAVGAGVKPAALAVAEGKNLDREELGPAAVSGAIYGAAAAGTAYAVKVAHSELTEQGGRIASVGRDVVLQPLRGNVK